MYQEEENEWEHLILSIECSRVWDRDTVCKLTAQPELAVKTGNDRQVIHG